jgi:hexosaminidase
MEKINMKTLLNTLFSVLFLIHLEVAAATIDVIPEPNQVTCNNGTFTLSSSTVIATDKSQAVNAHLLQGYMKQAAGVDLKIANAAKNVIKLKLNSSLSSLGKEGYNLKIDSNSITITAATARGIFYGIQTLRQLVMSQFSSAPLKLTCVDISDQPVFAYRGMMLDTGRFYYTPEFIKKFLDIMALQKMNKFHWHFIEDAGWRPEIKKYPNLVKEGAFINPNDKSTGGYYSQKQMKEIVKYAQDRQIDIIPEVELPAHSLSALVAYPFWDAKVQDIFYRRSSLSQRIFIV